MLCYENQEKRVLEKREINSVEYHRGAKTGKAGKKHFCLVIKKPGLLFNEQYESQGQKLKEQEESPRKPNLWLWELGGWRCSSWGGEAGGGATRSWGRAGV